MEEETSFARHRQNLLKEIENQVKKEWNDSLKKLIKSLRTCRQGEEVNLILENLQHPRAIRKALREQVGSDLKTLLAPLNVESVLEYGSTCSDLDFIDSDFDFYVQLHETPANKEVVINIISTTETLVRDQSTFRYLAKALGRVPIIKILHEPTKTSCDVSFNSLEGYTESCFTASLINYDERIKDLAIIIKAWGKSFNVSDLKCANYCLVTLMIFYLQNLDQPMLDTIMNVQKGQPRVSVGDSKWNFYYNDNMNLASQNNMTLRQLLVGFFEFYSKLDYKTYIVCLYNGQLIKRNEFSKHPDLAEYRQVVAETKTTQIMHEKKGLFIVQDGFELDVNVGMKNAKNRGISSANELFNVFRQSHLICVELEKKPFSTLLAKLFTGIKLTNKKRQKVGILPDWVQFLGVCLVLIWTASVNKFIPLMILFLLIIYFATNKKSATNIKWKIFRVVHAIRRATNKTKVN